MATHNQVTIIITDESMFPPHSVAGGAGPAVLQVHLQGPQPVHLEAREADAPRAQPHVGLQSVPHRLPGEKRGIQTKDVQH